MSINFSNGITKVLRILKHADRPQARAGVPSTKETETAELQATAHNYYQSVIENSSIKTKTFSEPSKSQSITGPQAIVQAQASDHWFDARCQNKGPRATDTNYRLQAYLQSTKAKELKSLDKNYAKRKDN